MANIEIAGWKKTSCDDGPGIRSVLFLQGCSMNCPGCHNSVAQKHGEGTIVGAQDLLNFLLTNCHNRRITISGGEPLEQWDDLKVLLRHLKEKGFDICLYTGWEMEAVPRDVFLYTDYIKCGSFKHELRSEGIHYVGSMNQRMYKKDSLGYWHEMLLSA